LLYALLEISFDVLLAVIKFRGGYKRRREEESVWGELLDAESPSRIVHQ
jgi:hypothetical protein